MVGAKQTLKTLRKILNHPKGIGRSVVQIGALVSNFASCRPLAITLGLNDMSACSIVVVDPKTRAKTPCCTVVNSELDRRALAHRQ